MAEGIEPFYVLQNFGVNRNCTLTASFPAVVSIDGIEVGGTKGNVNYDVSLFILLHTVDLKSSFFSTSAMPQMFETKLLLEDRAVLTRTI